MTRLCFHRRLWFCSQEGDLRGRRGHAWVGVWQGGMHGRRGMHGRGACVVGVCMVGGIMHGRGNTWQGCVHGRVYAWQGVCMAGGCAWQVRRVCVAGEGHAWPGGHTWQGAGGVCGRQDGHCNGQYTSYRILLICKFSEATNQRTMFLITWIHGIARISYIEVKFKVLSFCSEF